MLPLYLIGHDKIMTKIDTKNPCNPLNTFVIKFVMKAKKIPETVKNRGFPEVARKRLELSIVMPKRQYL